MTAAFSRSIGFSSTPYRKQNRIRLPISNSSDRGIESHYLGEEIAVSQLISNPQTRSVEYHGLVSVGSDFTWALSLLIRCSKVRISTVMLARSGTSLSIAAVKDA